MIRKDAETTLVIILGHQHPHWSEERLTRCFGVKEYV